MLKLVVILVVFLSSFTSAKSSDKILERGQTVGTFEGFDWGDYAHIKIKKGSKEVDFFAEGGPVSVFEDFQTELKGVKIKVYWERVLTFIPQAEKEIEITRTTDICAITPIHYESKLFKEKVKVCK
jgi:hypothetical protein